MFSSLLNSFLFFLFHFVFFLKKILNKLEELLSRRFGVEGHFANTSHCKLHEKCFTNKGLGLSLLLSLTFILPVTNHPTPVAMILTNSWTIRMLIIRFEFLSSFLMFLLLLHKGDSYCLLLICVLFSLVWKHVCWGKRIGRIIWEKEIGKKIMKRKEKRHFTNMKFPRRGIDVCWFSKNVTQTSTLNLKHQNWLCCFITICKEHRAPVHPLRGWEASFHRVSNNGEDVWRIIKLNQNKQNRFPFFLKR